MSTSANNVIFGLAGTFASGKDSLARHLEEKFNIKHISTGDIVRIYAQEKYGSIERPVLYKMANELRETKGNPTDTLQYGLMRELLPDTIRLVHERIGAIVLFDGLEKQLVDGAGLRARATTGIARWRRNARQCIGESRIWHTRY